MNEPQHPIRRTKKTPPTLANPNSLDDVGSTSVFEHKPPPRSSHHFFFRSWSTPFSCSISIAPLMGVLYGESRQKESFPFFFFFFFQSIYFQNFVERLLRGKAIPYPLLSMRPPTLSRSQFLSILYSIVVDSMRKA